VKNAGIELGVLYEKITNNPTFLDVFNSVFNSIMSDIVLMIKNKTLPIEKRFKIIDVNIETEIVFDQWLKEIV